ncbi:hypothetical protein DFP72DRAFT_214884 [Ephemerocybe angulata]|uniref:MYND-type domain-containing protein n=1 Tax=Ephemerocybe angulata TaxID=980116 RepID=A0A8H6LTH5_9AGAR|nr:hypothetical protein DFP72DRAFT_214884 [Tulosesus angulatus]
MTSPVCARFQESSQSLQVNRSEHGDSHPVPEAVIARAIRFMTKNAVPRSGVSLGFFCLTNIRTVVQRLNSIAEHASISNPNIQAHFCSEASAKHILSAWRPLCSWIKFLLEVDPQELHDFSKADCLFAATSSINFLSVVFVDDQPRQALIHLLGLLWKPGNVLHTVGHINDVGFRQGFICPFVTSVRILRSAEARDDFFRSTSSRMIEDISREVRSRLELLEASIFPLLHDHEAGQIHFKEVLRSLKTIIELVNCLSHDARHRSAMLEKNIFVIGVQIAVAALEDNLSETPFDLIHSTLRVLADSTLPLPYQMETLSQLIRGGLVHLLQFYLEYSDEEATVLGYTEKILTFITAHTSNDSVSEALHEFLDDNDVEFDSDLDYSVVFHWYLNQSYLADEGKQADTYLPPSCSSIQCSAHLTNAGSRAVIPCFSCKKVAYCSDVCAAEDWKLHESECEDSTAITETEMAGGRNLLPVSEEIFLWSIRNIAENFTFELFPGDTSPISLTHNGEVTHCDMRCVPVLYDHSSFTSYVMNGAVYIPEHLRSRRSSYILRAMQNRFHLRLVEFVFPYGTQVVIIIALLSRRSGRLPRYSVLRSFTHIIPNSSAIAPSRSAKPIYLISDGPLLPLAGRASFVRTG